jgi:hypothetical protein
MALAFAIGGALGAASTAAFTDGSTAGNASTPAVLESQLPTSADAAARWAEAQRVSALGRCASQPISADAAERCFLDARS